MNVLCTVNLGRGSTSLILLISQTVWQFKICAQNLEIQVAKQVACFYEVITSYS